MYIPEDKICYDHPGCSASYSTVKNKEQGLLVYISPGNEARLKSGSFKHANLSGIGKTRVRKSMPLRGRETDVVQKLLYHDCTLLLLSKICSYIM